MTPEAPWGDKIRALRKQRGLSQRQLAGLAGVRLMTVSQIERGSNTTTDTLVSLAKALGVGIGALMNEKAYDASPFTRQEASFVADRIISYVASSPVFRAFFAEAVQAVDLELRKRQ